MSSFRLALAHPFQPRWACPFDPFFDYRAPFIVRLELAQLVDPNALVRECYEMLATGILDESAIGQNTCLAA
jgi:hypothetical protein